MNNTEMAGMDIAEEIKKLQSRVALNVSRGPFLDVLDVVPEVQWSKTASLAKRKLTSPKTHS